MRDQEIYSKLHRTNEQVGAIYRQMLFVDTRLQAFETIMKQKSQLFRAFFSPKNFISKVDHLQLQLMAKHDEDLKKQVQEHKAKPKLTLVSPNGAA